jgi:ribose 5-phosphate isomerase B
MSMTANRHHGVRAALCGDVFTASMSRQHNDANVLCIGARVVGGGLAAEILKAFLSASFEGGRHERRVKKIEPSNEG